MEVLLSPDHRVRRARPAYSSTSLWGWKKTVYALQKGDKKHTRTL